MSFGELGVVPPSHQVSINSLSFYNRLIVMDNERLPKIVFNELSKLEGLGFHAWVGDIKCIAKRYEIDLSTANLLGTINT